MDTTKIKWEDFLEMPLKRSFKNEGPVTYQSNDGLALVEENSVLVSYPKTPVFQTDAKEVFMEDWISGIAPMLSPQTSVPEYFMSNHNKAKLVEEGISKVSFEHFKEKAGLDYNQWALLLSAARNTLINKRGTELFSFDISEKLVALAEVYTHGLSVFDDWNKFNSWLHNANRALGGVTPFSLLSSQYGRNEVHKILGRIEWGIYS
jgi:putative toxin-antitoxin system antitoxin component (TIGR02293 family)